MPIPGLLTFPIPPPRGPLALKGQVTVLSGNNEATVTGLTPESVDPSFFSAFIGPEGIPGLDGRDGLDGAPGQQGQTGPQGLQGAQGPAGPEGVAGQDGAPGLDGPPGATGPTGPQGNTGPQGPTGANGLDGLDGRDGVDGLDGQKGDTGPQGPQGIQGIQGLAGPQGLDGADGRDGIDGARGDTGPQGPAGADGATGPAGRDGTNGLDGRDGADGLDGAPGATGPAGAPGATGAQGPAGADGQPGFDGQDGEDAPFAIPLYPWWQSLQLDNHTRGFKPIIDSGDFIQFVNGTGGTEQIQSSSSFTVRTTSSLTLTGDIQAVINSPNAVGITVNSVRRLTFGSGGDWQLGATFVPGTAGQVLTSQGAGNPPLWVTPTGGGGGGAVQQVVSVNFGSTPQTSGFFDITGLSGLTLNTTFQVSIAPDPNDPSEAEETCLISGIAISTTVIRCYWHALTVMAGTRTVQFFVPTSVTGIAYAASGNAINVSTTVDLVGSTSVVSLGSISGSLGVVNISSLLCGGTLTVTTLAEASIDGFTAKTQGFWFLIDIQDASTGEVLRLIDNVGATTTTIRTPDVRDHLLYKKDSCLMYYSGGRWRVGQSMPKLWLTGVDSQTISGPVSDWTRASVGQNRIRVAMSGGDQSIGGVVPQPGNTQNGEIIVIDNADTTETLRLIHENTGTTAANRFVFANNQDLYMPPKSSATFAYDDTSQRWRCIGHSVPTGGPAGPGNTLWEDESFRGGPTAGSCGTTSVIVMPNTSVYWHAVGNGASSGTFAPSDQIDHPGIVNLSASSGAGNRIGLYHAISSAAGATPASLGLSSFGKVTSIEWWVNPQVNTACNFQLGLGNDASSGTLGTAGIFFEFDASLSSAWRTVSRASSTSSASTTTVTMTPGNWWYLRFEITPNLPTVSPATIRFFINDVLQATHVSGIQQIPVSGSCTPIATIQTTTALAKNMLVDRCRVYVRNEATYG